MISSIFQKIKSAKSCFSKGKKGQSPLSFFPQMKTFSFEVGGQTFTIETGKLAQMANGSVVVSSGETTILATATMSKSARDGVNFLPLMVNYQEKFYAAGMIKSSRFQKREMRPSDEKILMSRLIDRQLRPLFPKHIRRDIQVMLTTLSYDGETEHDMVAAVAASAALAISDIPWAGPTASVRVGLSENGEFLLNPTHSARENSPLDLVVASSTSDIVMIEAGAKEIPEDKMLEALAFGKKYGIEISKEIAKIAAEIGKPKIEIPAPEVDTEVVAFVEEHYTEEMRKCIFEIPGKLDRFARKAELAAEAAEKAREHFGEDRDLSAVGEAFDGIFKKIIRESILKDERRIAGRRLDEIRPLHAEVGLLKRAHGSGLFQRGETQGLSIATLAAPGNELIIDGIEGDRKERYLHHYNFPPYSVGECSNRLFVGNREIGHGALAERALRAVLPPVEDFPYVIRVVSEILQSNGSSSMAATCGSTLALMDAGVPITAPVSGIAMGLMTDEAGNFKILSDIQDEEDFGGDMDFKVAGTKKGITAIQMDVKIPGISEEIFRVAFEQARKGRLEILEVMLAAIPEPRPEISPYAPRLLTFKINPDKIREVIGKGGEVINGIIAETGVEINLEDDGTVVIASADGEAAKKAEQMVLDIVAEMEVGKTYDATVVRLEDYGAFVEIKKGVQGLVHISLLKDERVEKVSDVLAMGQQIRVKLLDIDDKGRLRLSLKDADR